MDIISPRRRSEVMSRIRGKDTKPEIKVRKAFHSAGLRFRLHRKDLPGTPDLVLPARKTAVFVHGCFWHQHPGCRMAYRPKSNVEFWTNKLQKNSERDSRALRELADLGWDAKVIWECQTTGDEMLGSIIRDWFPDVVT